MSNSLRPHELQHARLLLSITISLSLLKLMSTESVMTSNHLILCHPLSLFPSIFPSIRFFSSESVLCIKWLKYLCLSFSISPSNQYSGLSSFGIDWFDLLAVQGTLKSLRQHHSGLGWSMANSATMWLSWRLVPSVCYKSKPFFYHNVHLIKKNKVLEPLESTFRRSQYFHTFKKVAGFRDPHICV